MDVNRAKLLFGRGGTVLALASVAHARGKSPGTGRWHALSPSLVAAVEQVLSFLESRPDPDLLTAALNRAMAGEPITAIPTWATPLVSDPAALDRIGGAVDDALIAPALPPNEPVSDPRTRGLAALAVAFCRHQDALLAITSQMPEPMGRVAIFMSTLAQATVSSGDPSRARSILKRRLGEVT